MHEFMKVFFWVTQRKFWIFFYICSLKIKKVLYFEIKTYIYVNCELHFQTQTWHWAKILEVKHMQGVQFAILIIMISKWLSIKKKHLQTQYIVEYVLYLLSFVFV